MKLIAVFLICFGFSAIAQQANFVLEDTVFYNLYGGPNQEEAKDFVETPDKGFFICGSSSSYGQGASSVYLVKTDSAGRFKWGKTYGGINADKGMSITMSPDKGAFIAGFTNSFGNFDYDAYCIKIDSVGNAEWQKTYAGSDWDFIYDSYPLADSGIVMVGETYSNTVGDADAYLIRINKLGDTLWTKKFGTLYQERFNAVTVINNSIYVCGKQFDPLTQTSRALIARYDLSGVLINSRIVEGNPTWNYEMNTISKTTNKQLLVGGSIVNPNVQLQQNELRLRIDTNLVNIWKDSSNVFVATKTCNHLFEDARQHVIASFTANGGNGKTAMFLADYDAGNVYKFGFTFGGLEEEYAVKGMLTSCNKLAFLGNTFSWVGTYNHGDEDFWLVLFKADTLISDHKIKYKSYTDTISLSPLNLEQPSLGNIKLFPNPVSKNGFLQIKGLITESSNVTFELLDLQGRVLYADTLDLNSATIDMNKLSISNGIYFVRITGLNGPITTKISVQD